MYKIREEKDQDILAIKEVNDLAFGREHESKLIEAIRNSEYFVPQLSLVAETDTQEIIGHILFSMITIETENGPFQSLALAPMAVKPKFQNKGIGSALVREGLKRCAELGYHSVVVLGHPDFYPKFGFIPASTKGIKAPFEVPDEVFMIYETKPGSLNGVKGIVKYPEAFSAV